MMKATKDLVNTHVNSVLTTIDSSLQEAECSHIEIIQQMQQLYRSKFAPDLFEGLQTQYKQRQFFSKYFEMIHPTKVRLPTLTTDYGRHRTTQPQHFKKQEYVVVSLISQLQSMLQKEDVFNQVFSDKNPVPGFLCRYEDGTSFLENPLFTQYPHALQIQLYLDEVQLCDALGSKVFNNKLVFVYFTIGNLEMRHRSTFNQIHLLAIFFNHQVEKFGLNVLLKPIVDELKKLEQGVEIVNKGESRTFFGTLAILTADNLASHAVGGFKLGFSKGFRKCRYCLGTDIEIQNNFTDCEFVERTKISHNLHCEALETDESEYFGKLYGLTSKSILNELNFFHVIGGNVPDVMHDWLEGVFPLVICKLLWYCIKVKHYFTLDMLNHAIKNFNYGFNEVKNKPSLIQILHLSKNKLRQSASQIWLLGTLIPLMLGTCIPPEDQVWLTFKYALEISGLFFKLQISELEISRLEFLIAEFLSLYKEVFPGSRITPKMHFIVHYPRFIRKLGPLVSFWCKRYEAKHSYFKQMSRAIGNFINLPFTLASRHQISQAQHFINNPLKFFNVNVLTPVKRRFVSLVSRKYCGLIAEKFSIVSHQIRDISIRSIPWITFCSTKYKKKSHCCAL